MSKSTSATATATLDADDAAELLGGIDPMEDGDDLDKELAGAGAPPPGQTVELGDLSSLELSDEPMRDYREMPDGWYECEIVKAAGGISGSGNKQIEFIFRVENAGEFDGVTVEDQAVVDSRAPKAHWKVKKIAHRVGLLGADGRLTIKSPQEFVGKRFCFLNKVDREYDAANPRNKAKDYAPLSQTQVAN